MSASLETVSTTTFSSLSQCQTLTASQIRVAFLVGIGILLLAISGEYSGLDLYLEGLVYDASSAQWPYKSLYVTSDILHTGGRYLVIGLALCLILILLASYRISSLLPYRKAMLFVLMAAITGPAIVSILKGLTDIYTPWSLSQFGGHEPYVRIFDSTPPGSLPGHAFPGGHSSGGFAWFGPFFLLLSTGSRWRMPALLLPLLLGGVFGITQEIRGAHFLSHDLVSMAICWLSTLAWARIMLNREKG